MGRRWAWMGMGMMGACALLSGCRERESHEQAAPVAARAPAPARPAASPSPQRVSTAPPADTAAQRSAVPAQATAPPSVNAPAPNTATQPAPTAPQGTGTVVTESSAMQEAPEGRVMIGYEAIQAREDEAWYEGAAKAARAAGRTGSVPLERVVIATGTVDGRVTRVDRGALHVRDSEGNLYRLRIDRRSRGLCKGQSVQLRQLEEGTPVRASFDLVGGHSIARDIEIRR